MNCPICNYPTTASGNFLGIYAYGCKCDGCGYLNEIKRKELQEKIEKTHKETEMYKQDMLKRTSNLERVI